MWGMDKYSSTLSIAVKYTNMHVLKYCLEKITVWSSKIGKALISIGGYKLCRENT